ncbi:hypothetical protein LSH36_1289g00084 [Paralvinella palmiformis]|uniref:Bis(5'-nucleosyl)-tetraphosphatase [asymmetrical] n=1 Tax=Paralvinella palmiformis TaxID=53620 RepID=A0AAD9MR10_9ANNE|nr:hypothetical protein LSH36_1289g00084 [Paralvinella palmiformis]
MGQATSKGHVDPGETEIETAYRETQEEAGLTRHHLRIIDGFKKTLNYEVSGIHKRVVYWLSELMDPNTSITLSDEHIRFEWRQLDKALELISRFENMQETLKEAEEFIKTLQQSPATVNNTNTDTDNI